MRLSFGTLALLAWYGDTKADRSLQQWEKLSRHTKGRTINIHSHRQVIHLTVGRSA